MLAYSARNRSASRRIPWVANPKARRIEMRFPDPIQSGYRTFADDGEEPSRPFVDAAASAGRALDDKDREFPKAAGCSR